MATKKSFPVTGAILMAMLSTAHLMAGDPDPRLQILPTRVGPAPAGWSFPWSPAALGQFVSETLSRDLEVIPVLDAVNTVADLAGSGQDLVVFSTLDAFDIRSKRLPLVKRPLWTKAEATLSIGLRDRSTGAVVWQASEPIRLGPFPGTSGADVDLKIAGLLVVKDVHVMAGKLLAAIKDLAASTSSPATEAETASRPPVETPGFFTPPAGASSSRDIMALARSRPRHTGPLGSLERMRREAQDAYDQFWLQWFQRKERSETLIRTAEMQRDRAMEMGLVNDAEILQRAIEKERSLLETFLATAPGEAPSIQSFAPLATFGLEVGETAISPERMIQLLAEVRRYLMLASGTTASAEAREELSGLSREIQMIESLLASGDERSAQAHMHTRWQWVLQG